MGIHCTIPNTSELEILSMDKEVTNFHNVIFMLTIDECMWEPSKDLAVDSVVCSFSYLSNRLWIALKSSVLHS